MEFLKISFVLTDIVILHIAWCLWKVCKHTRSKYDKKIKHFSIYAILTYWLVLVSIIWIVGFWYVNYWEVLMFFICVYVGVIYNYYIKHKV